MDPKQVFETIKKFQISDAFATESEVRRNFPPNNFNLEVRERIVQALVRAQELTVSDFEEALILDLDDEIFWHLRDWMDDRREVVLDLRTWWVAFDAAHKKHDFKTASVLALAAVIQVFDW